MRIKIVVLLCCSLVFFSCSQNKETVIENDGMVLWSSSLITIGTYDSLIKVKGNPKREHELKLKREKFEDNQLVPYGADTIVLLEYFDGTEYFRYGDSVQLRTVDFSRVKEDVYFKKEKYNAQCSLKKFIRTHSVEDEYIQRVSGFLYGDDEKDGYSINIVNNEMPHDLMEVYFDSHKKLKYVNFGIYNGGILR